MEDRIPPNKCCHAGTGPQGAVWPCLGCGEPIREPGESLVGSDQPWHAGRLYCGRRVRVRSVLSDGQLGALRSCYSRMPRPDAALKLRLAQHTGLSPRVVRVWFQNKRCKDKKSQDKRARRLAEELCDAMSNYRQPRGARLMVVDSPDPPASAVPITVHESPWQQDSPLDPGLMTKTSSSLSVCRACVRRSPWKESFRPATMPTLSPS
ncbi:insulin gene enhancer protein ISL-2-like isoform X1 [Osmerus eperlanus]|uniref:insulin gene enhancer protein ISL-2-like isoform X1 n=1 Tax=Osmerus eperlanus TaxID=29151 RepID=UPI002E0FE8D1